MTRVLAAAVLVAGCGTTAAHPPSGPTPTVAAPTVSRTTPRTPLPTPPSAIRGYLDQLAARHVTGDPEGLLALGGMVCSDYRMTTRDHDAEVALMSLTLNPAQAAAIASAAETHLCPKGER